MTPYNALRALEVCFFFFFFLKGVGGGGGGGGVGGEEEEEERFKAVLLAIYCPVS